MNFTASSGRAPARFNMTPMIDVVLQLIIFFMYTSTFATMVRTPVDLPELEGESDPAEEAVTLTIDVTRDGRLYVAGVEESMDGLLSVVRAEADARHGGDLALLDVLVRADEQAPSRHVNAVVRSLTSMGVRRWATGSEQPVGGN